MKFAELKKETQSIYYYGVSTGVLFGGCLLIPLAFAAMIMNDWVMLLCVAITIGFSGFISQVFRTDMSNGNS